jgi:hypothetical protein
MSTNRKSTASVFPELVATLVWDEPHEAHIKCGRNRYRFGTDECAQDAAEEETKEAQDIVRRINNAPKLFKSLQLARAYLATFQEANPTQDLSDVLTQIDDTIKAAKG